MALYSRFLACLAAKLANRSHTSRSLSSVGQITWERRACEALLTPESRAPSPRYATARGWVTYQPDIVRDLEDSAGKDEDALLGQQLLGEVDVVLDVLKLLDFNSHLRIRERRSRQTGNGTRWPQQQESGGELTITYIAPLGLMTFRPGTLASCSTSSWALASNCESECW